MSSISEEKKKNWLTTWPGIVSTLLSVLAVWAVIMAFAPGKVGDPSNAATSLFSALAFAAVILTLAMQREELTLQREEMKASRVEYHEQAEALKQSAAAGLKQLEMQIKVARLTAQCAMLDAASAAVVAQSNIVSDYHVDARAPAMSGYRDEVNRRTGGVILALKQIDEEAANQAIRETFPERGPA